MNDEYAIELRGVGHDFDEDWVWLETDMGTLYIQLHQALQLRDHLAGFLGAPGTVNPNIKVLPPPASHLTLIKS